MPFSMVYIGEEQEGFKKQNPESIEIPYKDVKNVILKESKVRNKASYRRLVEKLDERFSKTDKLPEFVLIEEMYGAGKRKKYPDNILPTLDDLLDWEKDKEKSKYIVDYISIPDDLPGDILILYQELFREENGLIYPRLFLKAFATIPEIPLYANRNRIKSIDTQGTYLREADVIYIGKEKDPLFLINRRNIGSKLDKKEERFQKSRKMVF